MNERQRRFVEAYMGEAGGNGTKAAKLAGYARPAEEAHRLLRNPKIRAMIDERVENDPLVATREERQRFLSAVLRGEHEAEMRDRLKATELLGKMQGDFVEKREISGPGGGPQEVLFQAAPDPQTTEALMELARENGGGDG